MNMLWVVLLFALGRGCSAERSEKSGKPSPANLVSHAVGSPLSVEQVEERVCNLPDGSSTVEVIKSKIYRDSAGRMTIEGLPGSPNESSVFMMDPISGARVVLSTRDKVAYRVIGPKAGENGFAYGAGGMGEALPPGDWRASTEKLERRAIDGIEVEGERITQSSADQPPLVAVYDRWYSSELKLILLAVASGPNGRHTARIENVRTGEPDPALFTVPTDYTITDMTFRGQR